MPMPSPNISPERDHDNWPAGLTDQELDLALDRVLREVTARLGVAATERIHDAMMRRFW